MPSVVALPVSVSAQTTSSSASRVPGATGQRVTTVALVCGECSLLGVDVVLAAKNEKGDGSRQAAFQVAPSLRGVYQWAHTANTTNTSNAPVVD